MNRALAPGLAMALVGLVMSGCGTTTSSSAQASDPSTAAQGQVSGRQALSFSSRTVDGAAFDGEDLAGRPVVLWFWAPWCPTCRAQIDDVSAAAEQYGDDVSFVGVGSLDDEDAIRGFAADVPATDVTELSDPDGEVWRHFAITEQSTYVVLDADGDPVVTGSLDDTELLDAVADVAAG